MRLESRRAFRKDLHLEGMIFLNEQEQSITIRNLSITGLLVELDQLKGGEIDIKDIFNSLQSSTLVDIFIPSMRLAGEMEVIRADIKKDKILIALEFKSVSYDVEDFIYRRKMYRKKMPGSGRILLNGAYYLFTAINVSVEGLMIQLNETITGDVLNTTVSFEFEKLEMNGEARIVWIEHPQPEKTLMGLNYVHLEKAKLSAIPRFENRYA
ncbi:MULTISPECIES: PilZ domain-containing protein [Methylomicrobium]|uniref:PilZ domain-containing protein n=1 Tax=Methylomicrobium album BG8 TaxID=686340 RepID=H8GK64_METAL|nr:MULTISPECIES: PilZ domain-containing protein [Methylomicrobium]EIC29188.1 PilZ domain-containing protein [Methylomicrobium album BG8]